MLWIFKFVVCLLIDLIEFVSFGIFPDLFADKSLYLPIVIFSDCGLLNLRKFVLLS